MASKIQVTNVVNETLMEWAKSKGISVKQLANDILSEACTYFLAGKVASLKETVQKMKDDLR